MASCSLILRPHIWELCVTSLHIFLYFCKSEREYSLFEMGLFLSIFYPKYPWWEYTPMSSPSSQLSLSVPLSHNHEPPWSLSLTVTWHQLKCSNLIVEVHSLLPNTFSYVSSKNKKTKTKQKKINKHSILQALNTLDLLCFYFVLHYH